MSWSIISADQVQPQRWKNDGGWTRELLAWPHPADWALRVSVADIEASGPFSAFPGVDRWFAVLQGEGVCLYEYEMRVGDELLHFDGALGPDCTLLKGPTRDFNLMHRRDKGRVQVQAADKPCTLSGSLLALFTAEGGTLTHGGRDMVLAPMSLAWCEQPAAQALAFKGRGAAWWMAHE
jgi:environmental stress-induced protein Ves